ncbi:uncharacterized protein LOC111619083 [Centruroides sculpturatus]|uniref:uncharacterized protein LOC111619083 n=1 Tax=Centruroides sculpturatus TaxID=218467 RepID=UPI000C6E0640|nr:uncharacterized protein LOC111619083 [Centruroides sculpturatus]
MAIFNETRKNFTTGKQHLSIPPEDILIMASVLTVWIIVIFIFFNKWGKIRMLEPNIPIYSCKLNPPINKSNPSNHNLPLFLDQSKSRLLFCELSRDYKLNSRMSRSTGDMMSVAIAVPHTFNIKQTLSSSPSSASS